MSNFRSMKYLAIAAGLISLISIRTEANTAANPGANPVANLVGKYKVNQCALYGFKGLEKATVRIVGLKDGNRILRLFGYSEGDKEETSFYLGSGVRDAMGTDGTQTWSTNVTATDVTFKERFEREKSDTWPDMIQETSVRFNFNGQSLKIYSEVVAVKGPGSSKKEYCEMTSISADKNEIQAFELAAMSDGGLEVLIAKAKVKMGDLDQASTDYTRGILTIKKPTLAQVKEVLSASFLPNFPDSGGLLVKSVKPADDLAKIAEDALGTVLTIAEDAIKDGSATRADYKNLFAYQKEIEKALKNRTANMRAYYVDWADSDSDGKGIFFIDTDTGEALYIGAAYFG